MIKSDLVEILHVLTTDERARLQDFLHSPYFNRGRDLAEVVTLIRQIYRAGAIGRDETLEKKRLYAAVFPDQPFIFNKLEKLASETLKWVRRFIETEMQSRQVRPEEGLILRAEFFMEKGLDDFYWRISEQLQAKWAVNNPQWDSKDYYLRWVAEQHKAEHLGERNTKKDDNNLRRSLLALDEFYLLERLQTCIILLSQNRVTPVLSREQSMALSEGLDAAHFAPFFEKPVGQLLRRAVMLLSYEDSFSDDDFDEYFRLLHEYQTLLPEKFLRDFETIAYNLCVPRYHRQLRYREYLFQLLCRFIESGRIYHNGFISAGMFQSAVTIRLLRKEYNEALQFLENHRHRIIGSQHPEEYYQFNLANYYFHIGQYDNALSIIHKVSYEEMQYKCSAKILEIKILYETDSNVLDSKIDAAKVYFFREQYIPPDKKEMYSRFIDFMRRLKHPQTEVNLERARKLLEEIRESPRIAEWPWLVEKSEQIVQKQQNKARR